MVEPLRYATPQQAEEMARMAEQMRTTLSRLAGSEVGYDATALQLLDEWIERAVQRTPAPSYRSRLTWASFLGEVLRRQYNGRWCIAAMEGRGDTPALSCPTAEGALVTIDIMGEVERRLAEGIASPLALRAIALRITLQSGGHQDW